MPIDLQTVRRFGLVGTFSSLFTICAAQAQQAAQDNQLDELKAVLEEQRRLIQSQQTVLEKQNRRLNQLERYIGNTSPSVKGISALEPKYATTDSTLIDVNRKRRQEWRKPLDANILAQNENQQPAPQAAAERKPEPIDTTTAGLNEIRGVLTPRNTLIVEPSLRYEQSASQTFFFNGLQVLETVLIGDINVNEADRDTITGNLALRYGLTNRLEAELSAPYIYRKDRITNEIVTGGGGTATRSIDGMDFGDIEGSLRYQFNSGEGGWPILIGSARLKSDTGEGPYDISRDSSGIETELATGSGFYSFSPGITAVYPVDPAVVFLNASYVWNIERDIDKNIGGNFIGNVDPGDVVGLGMGMSFALNSRVSASLSYEHNFVDSTETESNGLTVGSDSFDVGIMSFGVSYRTESQRSINVNVGVGVTEDAPDVQIGVTVPFGLSLD